MSWQLLEERLGYHFSNRSLLRRALTHRSYSTAHYERLEFLGDSVLNLVIAHALYERFPEEKEGHLSRLRAHLVSQEGLVAVAMDPLRLGDFLILGEGERRFFPDLPASLLSDALEALIGAVFLDASFPVVADLVERLFSDKLSDLSEICVQDPKTRLQERLQAHRQPLPTYAVIRRSGEVHQQIFTVSCEVDVYGLVTQGTGSSRRRAEQAAAEAMLAVLTQQGLVPIHRGS